MSNSTMTVVFNISRLVEDSGQLWLGEYVSKATGDITTLARLHYGAHYFVSGLPYALVEGDDLYFTEDRAEGFEAAVVKYNINFGQGPVDYISSLLFDEEEALTEVGRLLAEPPTGENGCSMLRGYQLHIEVDNSFIDLKQTKEGVTLKEIAPEGVVKFRLVRKADPAYVSKRTQVKLGDAVQVMFTATKRDAKPVEGPEATRALLLGMMAKKPSMKARKLTGINGIGTTTPKVVAPVAEDPGQTPAVVAVEAQVGMDILKKMGLVNAGSVTEVVAVPTVVSTESLSDM